MGLPICLNRSAKCTLMIYHSSTWCPKNAPMFYWSRLHIWVRFLGPPLLFTLVAWPDIKTLTLLGSHGSHWALYHLMALINSNELCVLRWARLCLECSNQTCCGLIKISNWKEAITKASQGLFFRFWLGKGLKKKKD